MEKSLDVSVLSKRTMSELATIAKDLKIETVTGLRKQELIAKILEAHC